jgi:hypothetical protein
MPPLMEGRLPKPVYLKIPKGTIIMARPPPRRTPKGKRFVSPGAIVWSSTDPKAEHDLLGWGTMGVYLGRKGPEIRVLVEGRVMLSWANRWVVVEPPKNVRKVSHKGVLLS